MARRIATLTLCSVALLLGAMPARAHVLYQRPTLHRLVQESTLVLAVEFEGGLQSWTAADGSDRQEYYAVRVLETLKGTGSSSHARGIGARVGPGARVEFLPHAEGMPKYAAGDRALLFLEPTAARPELLSLAGRFPWYSLQDAGREWKMGPADEDELRRLAREHAALAARPAPETIPALRALLLQQLASRDARVRLDALSELVRARELPGFFARAKEVSPFAQRARERALPPAERIGLALVLDGAPGFDGNAALRALTRETLAPADEATLLRVAAARPDPALSRYVAARLASPDPTLRLEAATALHRPWHTPFAPALVELTKGPDPALARAAARSLTEISATTPAPSPSPTGGLAP